MQEKKCLCCASAAFVRLMIFVYGCASATAKRESLIANRFYRRRPSLAEPDVFKSVYIDYGVPVWKDGEIDIAPETLYEQGEAEDGVSKIQ